MPFDGQEFIDIDRIKWIYDKPNNVWINVGQVDTVPLADATNPGLLSALDKAFIDRMPIQQALKRPTPCWPDRATR